jgi:hypothetical protein
MQIVAILIGLLIAVGIGWYVSRPLLQAKRLSSVDAPVLSMEVQRDSLYLQIRELDLDHATGKINTEDYQRTRSDLVAQAADLLRQIDGQAPVVTKEADLEAMIASRRKKQPVSKAAVDQPSGTALKSEGNDVEALIAARRKQPPAVKADADQQIEDAIKARRSEIVCPNCGKPATPEDVFCSRCGTALKQPQKV